MYVCMYGMVCDGIWYGYGMEWLGMIWYSIV